MRVKFTNNQAAVQNIFKDGQVVVMLKPGKSFITEDEDLIKKLTKQTNMEAEETTEEESDSGAPDSDDEAAKQATAAAAKGKSARK